MGIAEKVDYTCKRTQHCKHELSKLRNSKLVTQKHSLSRVWWISEKVRFEFSNGKVGEGKVLHTSLIKERNERMGNE